jgi:hypothetical protein
LRRRHRSAGLCTVRSRRCRLRRRQSPTGRCRRSSTTVVYALIRWSRSSVVRCWRRRRRLGCAACCTVPLPGRQLASVLSPEKTQPQQRRCNTAFTRCSTLRCRMPAHEVLNPHDQREYQHVQQATTCLLLRIVCKNMSIYKSSASV